MGNGDCVMGINEPSSTETLWLIFVLIVVSKYESQTIVGILVNMFDRGKMVWQV